MKNSIKKQIARYKIKPIIANKMLELHKLGFKSFEYNKGTPNLSQDYFSLSKKLAKQIEINVTFFIQSLPDINVKILDYGQRPNFPTKTTYVNVINRVKKIINFLTVKEDL